MSATGPVAVRLLGRPRLEAAGSPRPAPQGRKAWALLALLQLSPAPPTRRQLADLLFAEARDPLAALRWTVAALRRALGGAATLGGDPLVLAWAGDVDVDVTRVTGGTAWADDLDGELLEGLALPDSPGFETWLLVERRRLAAAADALLREAAVAALAAGQAGRSVELAGRLAVRQPYEEGAQALLVRALAAAGDGTAAREHVAATAARFRRELGHPPSPALGAAAELPAGHALPRPAVGAAGVRALLQAGCAATAAGAADAGLDCLRRALDDAARIDAALHAEAALALGSALVHAVRGRDEEGSVALHTSLREAERCGDAATAATACRELGFVDVQAGRRERAAQWLDRAAALAQGDDRELSAVLGVRGMDLSDRGRTTEALAALGESVERARRAGSPRQTAWSLSIAGRAHLLRDDDAAAEAALAESLDLVRDERWMAFLPWPLTLRAELDLRRGRVEQAATALESSFELACQVTDPCWEGMAARGLGLLAARRGRRRAAGAWLHQARRRCTRWPDGYVWVQAAVLDAVCTTAAAGEGAALRAVDDLLDLAGRARMDGFLVRAHEHAARHGRDGATQAGRYRTSAGVARH